MSDSKRPTHDQPQAKANLPDSDAVAAWTLREMPLGETERRVLERMSDWVPALTIAGITASALLIGVVLTALLGGGVSTPLIAVAALMPAVLVAVGLLLPGFLRARHDLQEGTVTHYSGTIDLYRDYTEGSGPTLQLLTADGRKFNTGPHEKRALRGRPSPMTGTLVYAPQSKRILSITDHSGVLLFDASAAKRSTRPPSA